MESARKLALQSGLEKGRLTFVQRDYNLPFDFAADESLDAHFCAQACMFVTDKTLFMKHSARVLKKGARFYGLEWVQLPAYDASNATHRQLVQHGATILGTSMPGPISAWRDAFEANGFKVVYIGHVRLAAAPQRALPTRQLTDSS